MTDAITMPKGTQGTCDICERDALLKIKDPHTGQNICAMCVHAWHRADTYLSALGPVAGVCHPQAWLP